MDLDAIGWAYFCCIGSGVSPGQPVLSDLNGLTVGTMAQARIAARNGLMPTMFITRVRL
jgi:hypothetical protein